MTLAELNDHFALPGVLRFEEHAGLVQAQVTLPNCTATVTLHGAQLTHWQPAGQAPVFFLSERAVFAEGKAIRGGIPISFPWFAARQDGQPGPSHGFARLEMWELAFAALVPGRAPADALTLRLTFTLAPSALSRSLGFDHFRLACEMIFGREDTVELRLSVANAGESPLRFEEAFHAYFAVKEVEPVGLTGLEAAAYLDKTADSRAEIAPSEPLTFNAATDSVFSANASSVTLHDPGHHRSIAISKVGSASTIVWNPWQTGAAKLTDLAPEAWRHFLCIEAANTGSDAITLMPGEAHTMQMQITATPTP